MSIIFRKSLGILKTPFGAGAALWTMSMSTRTLAMWPMLGAIGTMDLTMSTIRRPTTTPTSLPGWWPLNLVLDNTDIEANLYCDIYRVWISILNIFLAPTSIGDRVCSKSYNMFVREHLRFLSSRFLAEITAKCCPPPERVSRSASAIVNLLPIV